MDPEHLQLLAQILHVEPGEVGTTLSKMEADIRAKLGIQAPPPGEPGTEEPPPRRLLVIREFTTNHGFQTWRPGDILPPDFPGAQALVEAGTVKPVDADYNPAPVTKAIPTAAPAGQWGLVDSGGEGAPESLIGRIPKTPYRERGRLRKWR